MNLRAYTLSLPYNEPDAIILAESPEKAAVLLGAELRSKQEEDDIWELVFPIKLFQPSLLGSEMEKRQDGMWHYDIPTREGKQIHLLLNLEGEVEAVMWLQEYPIVVGATLQAV